MFNSNGVANLIDFECCAFIGSDLMKEGYVAGWRVTLLDSGEVFKLSLVKCNELAIQ